MGLPAGRGDIYPWDIEGNYVVFGSLPDGHYMVRVTTNVGGFIHEPDSTDNASYAYVEVAGNAVKVLERGIGLSPFDPVASHGRCK